MSDKTFHAITIILLNQSGIWFIFAIFLLILSICIFCLWFSSIKKNTIYRSLLVQKEIEEQTTKMQLEKYEKEFESIKNTVSQLQIENEELYTQINEYEQRINEYNLTIEKQHDKVINEATLNNLLLEDIVKLVNKKLPKKREYVELLDRVDVKFISTLKSLHDENLSIPYIKYCICFAIGMDIGDVSECFSIEQSSVHMARYRLKKKFGLNNHDDLDVFLRSLKT